MHTAWEEHPIRSKHHGDQHPMERYLCTRASMVYPQIVSTDVNYFICKIRFPSPARGT
jgi:hypothetical protein